MRPFLIIKTGSTAPHDPAPGDFEDWTAAAMGLNNDEWTCRNVRDRRDELPELTDDWAGAVITGSYDMVTERTDWMQQAADEVRFLHEHHVPLMGICFGHQLLAEALGGEAGYCRNGLEAGTARINLTEQGARDPLFAGLPAKFPAHVVHSQSALTLPPNAVLLAENDHDPHHAFRLGAHTWGVQFHPEFPEEAGRYYARAMKTLLEEQGKDSERLAAEVCPTPQATSLLRRFVAYCSSLG